MKVGIIIIFEDSETLIDTDFFIKNNNESECIKLCMVDNASKDNTLKKIKRIKDYYNNEMSIIEIKKRTSEKMAKRAGSRYMLNAFNLNFIGFITISKHCNTIKDFKKLFQILYSIKEVTPDIKLKLAKAENSKPKGFENVLSVVENFRIKKPPSPKQLLT